MAFQHYDSKLWIVALILFTGLSFALALPALAQAQGSSMWDGLSAPAEKTIIYVAKTGAGPDGISWRRAYTELQSALGVATSDNDIWVATGTYTPGEIVSDTFHIVQGVAIYGGFSPEKGVDLFEERDWEMFPTVLSGYIKGDDITAKYGIVTTATNIMGENSYHVVVGSSVTKTAVLDGFTITAGKAEGGVVDPCDYQCGGGLYNHSSSPTLVNVNFSGNSAASSGGGIFNNDSSNPSLTDVTFTGNSATSGGGMLNFSSSPTLTEVEFSGNSATWGGGIDNRFDINPILATATFSGNSANWGGGMMNSESSPSVMDVAFVDNSAMSGGGMYNSSSSPTLTHVIFFSNTASQDGGDIYNSNSSLWLTDVYFTHNSATSDGGGMHNSKGSSPTLINVTFISNTAAAGGGIFNYDSSNPLMSYVTFFSNTASSGGGMSNWDSSPSLVNVTLSGNSSFDDGGGMFNNSSNPQLINVIFRGNSAASSGGGMFNANSNPTLTNVSFSGNLATWNGGGMVNGPGSNPNMRNSILWNNRDSSGTGTISATIYNSISTITLTHSLAQGTGGSASWTTDPSFMDAGENLDTDPLFYQNVDPAAAPTTAGDLRLKAESPAINTGDDQYVSGLTTDLDGNPRISGGSVDMGAYEFQFYPLTVSLAGSGSGSVSSAGISCGTDCTEVYADGTVVTLTAIADTGSTFAGWSGVCTNTTGDCLVKMTAAKLVTATFTLDQYTLSVSLVGNGSGTVTSDPVGIECSPAVGADCDQVYDYGTVVTLTEAADPGSSFTGWSGACSGKVACVLTLTEPISVTAEFSALDIALDLYLPLVSR